MKTGFAHIVSLLGCALATVATGCLSAETGPDSGEDAVDSLTDPSDDAANASHEYPSTDPQMYGGACCNFKCSDGYKGRASSPEYGQCGNYARYFCASFDHGHHVDHWWGACP